MPAGTRPSADDEQDRPPRAALHSTPAPPWMRDRNPPPRPGSPEPTPSREPAGTPDPARADHKAPAGRHCWVYPPRECTHLPKAGLLLEWRRGESGYEGLVVYLADLAGGRPLLQVQERVEAKHLRPAR